MAEEPSYSEDPDDGVNEPPARGGGWMPVLLAAGVLFAVVTYSLTRSITFHEVFLHHPRYHRTLLMVNWMTMGAVCVVIACSSYCEGYNNGRG